MKLPRETLLAAADISRPLVGAAHAREHVSNED
jgi:hypothetical protein